MRVFKYDVLELIQGIKDRPCLWDKTLEVYKDRTERRTAWEEVFGILDANYKLMTAEEKRVTGEIVLRKWTNIRDTFIKTLKIKGRPRRKYVLYEYLKFLLKVTPAEDEFPAEYTSDDSTAFANIVKVEKESPKQTTSHKKKSKKILETSVEYDEDEPERSKKSKVDKSELDYVEVDECNDPRIMNEDEAFFASLLPSVVRYSEDERLEFRIEVLAVMKKIKDKREWSTKI